MDIDVKILGPGCKKCLEVASVVRTVAYDRRLPTQVEIIGNSEMIAEFGVIETPAVVVDGDVKCMGRVPSPSEVFSWLNKAAGREERPV